MNRQPILVAIAGLAAVGLLAAATNVTFVFKHGQRQSGEFAYHHDTNYDLIINGQDRRFPSDDIALIEFVPGDPPAKEIAALSDSDNPPEHDRHMLAFRDGRTLRGKIYDFQGDNILIDARDGSGNITRQTFPMSAVARLYVSAPSSRDLFPAPQQAQPAPQPPPSRGNPPVAEPPPGRGSNRPGQRGGGEEPLGPVVRVEASRAWTDTGFTVRRGDRLSFSTRDQIYIDRRIPTGPEGTNAAGRQDLPVRILPVGALIGRVERSAPFPIGGNTSPILMPASGRLFLGINDNRLTDNSGFFGVVIQLRPGYI